MRTDLRTGISALEPLGLSEVGLSGVEPKHQLDGFYSGYTEKLARWILDLAFFFSASGTSAS